jgi:hypothetical protein
MRSRCITRFWRVCLAALCAVNPIILQADPESVSEPAPSLLLLFSLLRLLYRDVVFQQLLVLRAP